MAKTTPEPTSADNAKLAALTAVITAIDGLKDHDRRDVLGSFLKGVEVIPEYLDPHLRTYPGREHLDAVDDRLRPDIGHAWHPQRGVHLGDEFLPRHPIAPLILRLQVDDGLVHVYRRRIS